MEMCNIENKHTSYDLKQMQSLPLEQKIQMTKNRIREWYEHWDGQVYVSFSGGKDSTVLKHIVDSMYKDVPALFVNTGLEYPEIQRFVKDVKAGKFDCFNPDVEIVRPEMRFDEVIRKYGYPTINKDVDKAVFDARTQARVNHIPVRETNQYHRRFDPNSSYSKKYTGFCLAKYDYLFEAPFDLSHKCCAVMKKKPAKSYEKCSGRKPILGIMADESRARKQQWYAYGCNAYDLRRAESKPLSFWTNNDILQYIVDYNVPYCTIYGEILQDSELKRFTTTGAERTGCIFCMYGVKIDKSPNRFQRLKETHPRQYEYCIRGGNGLMENGNRVKKDLVLERCWIS